MRRICVWCGHDLGFTPPFDEEETYGICDHCIKWVGKSEDELIEMLAHLASHVQRRRKRTANDAAVIRR
jgi:hypothetical protein